MHELAIAESITNILMAELEKRKLKSITRVAVNIGTLTDIVPEALSFGFQALTSDTVFSETQLEIVMVPAQGRCNNCGIDFMVSDHAFICPHCESTDILATHGAELDIAYLEVDDGA